MQTPEETLETAIAAGKKKSSAPVLSLLLKSFLAGLAIAFAALASTVASMNLLSTPETYGLGKLVQGLVFSGGLIFVILTSSELFTGNSLMFIALFRHEITPVSLLRNWGFVFLGNFLGALFLASVISLSGIFPTSSGLLGETLIKFASAKTSLPFGNAFFLGLLCNILVCLAVWIAFSAKSLPGKFLACIFPVTFFIICGFEHSIANMFYIPAGIFAGADLSIWAFFGNLLPVTLGNIFGGALLSAIFHFTINWKNAKISICENNSKSTLPEKSPKKKSLPAKTPSPKVTKSSQKTTKTPKSAS